MLHRAGPIAGSRSVVGSAPWTLAGGPDPDFDDAVRASHHMLLTDANLLRCFREHFPEQTGANYDQMIRALGYVWDCRYDATANVTGYCCAGCGRPQAAAAH